MTWPLHCGQSEISTVLEWLSSRALRTSGTSSSNPVSSSGESRANLTDGFVFGINPSIRVKNTFQPLWKAIRPPSTEGAFAACGRNGNGIFTEGVNAGEKMHQQAGVKLHRDGMPKAPTGGLLPGDRQDEKPNCLTRECYRVVEP